MIPWVLLDFLGILHHLPKQTMMWKKSVACGQLSMVTFIGTNCRINTYTLLKGKIKIPQVKSDSELLFQDKDAIDKGKLFNAKDQANFDILFQGSRPKLPKMSRFTPSIWRITTSSSPLMTRHACCRSLFMIIWMEILFLSVTLASWYLRQMDTYLSKN